MMIKTALLVASPLMLPSVAALGNCTRTCENEGKCVLEWRSVAGQSHAMEQVEACKCAPGFTGPSCATQHQNLADQCTLDCENGGQCIFEWMETAPRSGGSYFQSYFLSSFMICDCPEGYTGTQCELETVQCDSGTTCLGGGKCSTDGSTCDCSAATDIAMCQSEIKYCDYNNRADDHDEHLFCMNGGTCGSVEVDESKEHHRCDCPKEYGGQYCEKSLDSNNNGEECLLACENGGVCELEWTTVNGFMDQFEITKKCNCQDGFTGDLCQVDESSTESGDPCTEQCFNEGECVWQWTSMGSGHDEFTKQMICECREGFTGNNCEQVSSEDECAMECHNGGQCVYRWETSARHTDVMVQNLGCECAFGFTGPSCEMVVDQSTDSESKCSLQCRNGGECVFAWMNSPNNNYFDYVFQSSMMICECPHGYMGMHCEYPVDKCEDDTFCFNGGACVEDPTSKEGTYTCDCSNASDAGGHMCLEARSPNLCGKDVVGMDPTLFCLNGGHCSIITVDGASTSHHGCTCPEGYGGSHCEQSLSSSTVVSVTSESMGAPRAHGVKVALVVIFVVGVSAVGAVLTWEAYGLRRRPPTSTPSPENIEPDGTTMVQHKAQLEESTKGPAVMAHESDIL